MTIAQHLFFKYAHIDVRQCVFNSQEKDERPYPLVLIQSHN